MKTKDMVSFRAIISTFYLLKLKANDACVRISKLEKLTSEVRIEFEVRALL